MFTSSSPFSTPTWRIQVAKSWTLNWRSVRKVAHRHVLPMVDPTTWNVDATTILAQVWIVMDQVDVVIVVMVEIVSINVLIAIQWDVMEPTLRTETQLRHNMSTSVAKIDKMSNLTDENTNAKRQTDKNWRKKKGENNWYTIREAVGRDLSFV